MDYSKRAQRSPTSTHPKKQRKCGFWHGQARAGSAKPHSQPGPLWTALLQEGHPLTGEGAPKGRVQGLWSPSEHSGPPTDPRSFRSWLKIRHSVPRTRSRLLPRPPKQATLGTLRPFSLADLIARLRQMETCSLCLILAPFAPFSSSALLGEQPGMSILRPRIYKQPGTGT